MVVPSRSSLLILCFVLATAGELCQSKNGTLSDTCFDESASFLQMQSRRILHAAQGNDKPALRAIGAKVSAIEPLDCSKFSKPIQVIKESVAYSVQQLNIQSGKYTNIFKIPFANSGFEYQRLNGCGISPVDSIIYCAMLVRDDERYYLVRIDQTSVEFVAKLPFGRWTNANSGGFSRNGTLFLGEQHAKLLVIREPHELFGVPGNMRSSVKLDLSAKQPLRPKGFFRADDIVVANVDLLGSGPEEFLFIMGQNELQIAKYDYELNNFTQAWKIAVEPYRWDRFYGAGWSYNNQVLFAENKGHGVYQVPLDYLKLIMTTASSGGYLPRVRLQLQLIGLSEETSSNDGLNCMDVPNPFVTETEPFDCAEYPKPIQALRREFDYEVAFLDYHKGKYTEIYSIPLDRLSPPIKKLNAFAISPLDNIIYSALVMDDWNMDKYPQPPPFYIARHDAQTTELIARVQAARGNPIAGTFDYEGNFYVISNPTLFKFQGLENMKGYSDFLDDDIPFFNMDSSAVAIAELKGVNQIADIVALPGNFDGQGNATWVLGVNTMNQLMAAKVAGNESKYWGIDTNDAIKINPRQNFGAAWTFEGEVYIASNDGVGVFQVPLANLTVPDGPRLELRKVGASDPIHDNDGFNCFGTPSPFKD